MKNWQFRMLMGMHVFTISVIYSHDGAKVMGVVFLYVALALTWRWWPFRGMQKDEQDGD